MKIETFEIVFFSLIVIWETITKRKTPLSFDHYVFALIELKLFVRYSLFLEMAEFDIIGHLVTRCASMMQNSKNMKQNQAVLASLDCGSPWFLKRQRWKNVKELDLWSFAKQIENQDTF